MAKLTKAEIKQHNQILDLINSDKVLTWEEKDFILENYHEGATNVNSEAGAFFTPSGLARDFGLEVGGGSLIDLCAGIGKLSFWQLNNNCNSIKELVCVELNSEYAKIGRRIVPEAEWIESDIFSVDFKGRHFDWAFSNPPFGNIKTGSEYKGKYSGNLFEYKVIELASTIADNGSFIIPQMSAGFVYSGAQYYDRRPSTKYDKFVKETGIVLNPGIGVDTSFYKDDWKGVSIVCEIAICDFTDIVRPEEITLETFL